MSRNLEATLLFIDFFKAFISLQRRRIVQRFLEFCVPKEIVTALKVLNKSKKDGDTNFFGIIATDTLASYMFLLNSDNVLGTSTDLIKENISTLKFNKKVIPRRNYNTQNNQMMRRFSQIHRLKPNF